jgi:putative transposase
VRWSRPLEGAPKTVTISREADGWYVCFSCAEAPVQVLPATGQEMAIDLGIEAFATLSNGVRILHPGWYRKAERALKTAQRRVFRARRGATAGARRSGCWRRRIRRLNASGRTFTIRRRWRSSGSTTRSITRTCRRPTWSGIIISPGAPVMQAGRRFLPTSPTRRHGPVAQ